MIKNRSEYESIANKKVHLLKSIISKTGNLYAPGIYEPFTLPIKAYLDSDYTRVIEEGDEVIEVPVVVEEYPTSFTSKEVLAEKAKNEINLKPTKVKVVSKKEEKATSTLNGDTILINEASKAELIDIKGIGKKTAENIIDARELSPFVNLTDLKERVDLPFGNSWDTYNVDFEVTDSNQE